MNRYPRRVITGTDHTEWLSLIDISGPWLSLPVLRKTWPQLDALDKRVRERLRKEHTQWQAEGDTNSWIDYVLQDLLGWHEALHTEGLHPLAHEIVEHDVTLMPSFALVEPGEDVKPRTTRLIGLISQGQPTARVAGSEWAATAVDRVTHLCRHNDVPLGLVTDGRWWALVWVPAKGATSSAMFDAVSWPEAAERDVVRALVSVLCRSRFFSVPDNELLPALLHESLGSQEEITEALGIQVREAVELLVTAMGRAGHEDLENISASNVYRSAVSVMMRIVFLLFAEERGLLPADNDLYRKAYSAGQLCDELEIRAREGSEDDLEHTSAGWHRLIALFNAVYQGITHPRLQMHPHDGSLFDPSAYPWLTMRIDDRTVLHMLRAVQFVQIGAGRNRERRKLSFRSLTVEQIGYVYEGLLSYEGLRANGVVVGLIGKQGSEAEADLAELEAVVASVKGISNLAQALALQYKDSGIGSVRSIEKRLDVLSGPERQEALRKLLAVTGGDLSLAERLLPLYGVIRTDLRDLPVVIQPGALYVTESSLRKNTGTHYTPRDLAEQVVESALEPLVYIVGPLQTADKTRWTQKSSTELLKLKVADIAMGSGAFLVAACRYLADKLVEAWSREGDERAQLHRVRTIDRALDADEDPVVIEARRLTIEHCLYGADINEMAVEMAKLSLWLVSMDPHRPFTFLDDRLVVGDSLLGLTSLDQLEVMHIDAQVGRDKNEGVILDWTAGVRSLVGEVADTRRRIAEVKLGDDPLEALATKRGLLRDAELRTETLRLFADLTVGATLAGSRKGTGSRDPNARADMERESSRSREDLFGTAAHLANEVNTMGKIDTARTQATKWLATDKVMGSFEREPIHWPLVFPEVFEQGGFDAVIGNPPFLGGKKVSGATGSTYREYLVGIIGRGTKGNADLIAYFTLRAHDLLNAEGQTGLIATNTLAQGDTREVGLDQLAADGVTIRQSVKSAPWPSRSAVLEYCAVWTSKSPLAESALRIADGVRVMGITPSLDPESRATGNPARLKVNEGQSFIGSYVLSLGFTMEPARARELIESDPRNAEVLFPYLNGQDLNTHHAYSPSRLVINFQDWSEDKAKTYLEPFRVIERQVKPERQRRKLDGTYALRKPLPQRYWQYADKRPGLYEAIAGLDRVIVITLVSKTVMPVMVPTGPVFSHALGVFATNDTAMLATLSSAPHYWWAVSRASTLETRVRYTPSDVFETLPLPKLNSKLRELGNRLDAVRQDFMLSRQLGLTKTYNLVHDPACADSAITELRAIHRSIDEATCLAYGWGDLDLDHGHHDLGRETRYTIGSAVRVEILDRLLEENHRRHAEEVSAGLHLKGRKSARPKAKPASTDDEDTLF